METQHIVASIHSEVNGKESSSSDVPALDVASEEMQWEMVSSELDVNLYTLHDTAIIHQKLTTQASIALVQNRYLGALPLPSFSYKAFTNVLCDLDNVRLSHSQVLYCQCWQNVLENTYNIYLLLHHRIDAYVRLVLGRDTENQHVLHACLPHGYKLEVLDGNNSLKHITHIGQHEVANSRVYMGSNYFLFPDFADQHEDDTTAEYWVNSACADNWKAASGNKCKQMWELFDETGIFACAYHHGFMLWLADMVHSGELTPLAMVAKALDMLVDNHLIIISRMGLKDLKILEHVFSLSNQLAAILAIDIFFQQWDEGKYLNLRMMILNNYKQGLWILNKESIVLEEVKKTLGIQPGDLEKWWDEEGAYIAELGKKSEADILAVAYIELLQQLDELQEQHASTLHDVIILEIKLKILEGKCWHINHLKYHETLKYVSQCQYHHAIDKLHKLVVQQLFELHKMNLSATGYCMRSHIAKALQKQCKAIQKVLQDYNKAASTLTPPCPPLEWNKVLHYRFLNKFMLLCENCEDILSKPWAHPVIHETIKQHCHVESHCLLTFILDEHDLFNTVEKFLADFKSPLLVAVQEYCECQQCINHQILVQISQIHVLDRFTGDHSYGTAKGTMTS
ncbi:hypothetical protein BDN71DRAFT_1483619 [Pleurotus eryngii]|uniref:Uncharacterized protein n=1 Tax=Pleurotus eryngii TaxID=5323 RepID=A0A9P5ZRR8_PLEER|nr:hypothetical protein BDN71DRAFT_1483619 [Pleurotus eryngii]